MGTDVKLSSEFTIIYGGEVIAYCTDFTLERNKEVIDITKLGDTWKNKKVDTKDFSVSFNGMVTRGDTVIASLWNPLTAYTVGQYVILAGKAWEAQGSTTGDNPTTDDGTNWLETSEWLVGTTYAADDLVYITSVAAETRIYKSLQGSNTGNDPLTETAYWERLETNYESLLNELKHNDTVVTCTIKPTETTETYYFGDGVLSSLSASFGVGDKATFSGTFEGSGELEKQTGSLYGPELVVNGGFDTDTVWQKNTGVTIAGGVGVCTAATNGIWALRQTSIVATTTTYKVVFTVSNYVAGGILCQLGWTNGTTRSANGTYEEEITTGASVNCDMFVNGGTFTGDIDNVSVKEVL